MKCGVSCLALKWKFGFLEVGFNENEVFGVGLDGHGVLRR
jgi:hypothetical protein